MYIEPGSTSQSLVMYLQDAVTGGAYTTEDQADWTFNYVREGDASATADASISAGTLGTWADGTSKPFGTTGLWQIDFADAAFAAGAKYVKLLVTHDNGLFVPKSVLIDLSVRGADMVECGGNTVGAGAIPNAAADAAGGLVISDAGALDIDTKLANTHEITAARMGALTDWIDDGRLDLLLDAILADTGTDGVVLKAAGLASDAVQELAREIYSASGTVHHIKYDASETMGNDGLSWATADETAGVGVKTVVEAASAGDVVRVGAGVFALGDNTINVPADVTVRGAGVDATRITSTADDAGGKGAIVHPGSNRSVVEHLTIHGIAAAGKFQYPFGAVETKGDAAFTDAVLRRVKLIADSDGLVLSHSDPCTLLTEDVTCDVKYDAVLIQGGDHVVWMVRPNISTLGPSSLYSGAQANGMRVLQGLVYCVEPKIYVAGATTTQRGILVSGSSSTCILWDPSVAVTEDGATSNNSLLQASSGTLIVAGGDYDRTMESGTITHIPVGVELAADAIKAAKIADDAFSAEHFATGAFTNDVIAASGANEIADAVLGRNVSNVEATAPEHSLCTIVLGGLESSIAGTIWTIRRTDGSTTHATKTVTADEDADPITGVA